MCVCGFLNCYIVCVGLVKGDFKFEDGQDSPHATTGSPCCESFLALLGLLDLCAVLAFFLNLIFAVMIRLLFGYSTYSPIIVTTPSQDPESMHILTLRE